MNVSKHTLLKVSAISFCISLSVDSATADVISEVVPNGTMAEAQNIDASFNVGDNVDVENATEWSWVSITGTGDDSFDYYSFEVPATGVIGIFDIDYGASTPGGINSEIFLYGPNGEVLAESAFGSQSAGAEGSSDPSGFYDSYINHTFNAPGQYIIVVGEYNTIGNPGGVGGNPLDADDTYTLQVSLSEHNRIMEPEVVVEEPVLEPDEEVVMDDVDGDGVADTDDSQPNSDQNPTVMMESCDTGVENTLMANGSNITDLLFDCANDRKNHGSFASCVTKTTNKLKKDGYIDRSDKAAIQRCAAKAEK